MKFLLELVTCYGPYGSSSTESEVRKPAEESKSLVAPAARPRAGRKRGKTAGNRSVGGAGDWSPSLTSISENNILGERNNKPRQSESGVGFDRNQKRKVGYRSNKDRDLSPDRDETWRASTSASLPAFSPTAFLF